MYNFQLGCMIVIISIHYDIPINYTGQLEKYNLSETCQTLLIWGNWFQIFFFLWRQHFAVLPDCCFFGRFLQFRFFSKFQNFYTKFTILFLSNPRRKWNCLWFEKNHRSQITGSRDIVIQIEKIIKLSRLLSIFLFSS